MESQILTFPMKKVIHPKWGRVILQRKLFSMVSDIPNTSKWFHPIKFFKKWFIFHHIKRLLNGKKNTSASLGWRALNELFLLSISSMNCPSMAYMLFNGPLWTRGNSPSLYVHTLNLFIIFTWLLIMYKKERKMLVDRELVLVL